jgi:Predicted periplasmic lipoprotein (DUF2279)
MKKIYFLLFFLFFILKNGSAQSLVERFCARKDTVSKPRLYAVSGVAAAGYTGVVYVLDQYWYAGYARAPMHSFDDSQEWLQMDKTGHFFTANLETKWAYNIFRWSGVQRKPALWAGAGVSVLFQTTLEVLDGYSAEWGFSWSDVGANTAGSLLYVGQQLAWKEERISLKLSSHKRDRSLYDYTLRATNNPNVTTSLGLRADALYGKGDNPFETILKDYNTLTLWTSVNIWSFLPNREESKFPKWLNIAVGYGAENLYRGEPAYDWTDKDKNHFQIDAAQLPRFRQFYIAPDIDLTKIKTKSKALKTLLFALNSFKFPLPAVEINGQGQFLFHPIYF